MYMYVFKFVCEYVSIFSLFRLHIWVYEWVFIEIVNKYTHFDNVACYIHIRWLLTIVDKTYINIIIMSCRKHGYPWPSLATSPHRSSPPAGLQGYIPYPHIAAVCMFELVVLLLLGDMWGSIGVHHLWARPYFSSNVLHVWFVLDSFRDGRQVAV